MNICLDLDGKPLSNLNKTKVSCLPRLYFEAHAAGASALILPTFAVCRFARPVALISDQPEKMAAVAEQSRRRPRYRGADRAAAAYQAPALRLLGGGLAVGGVVLAALF